MAMEPASDDWAAGPIGPKPAMRSVPISVRIPQDVYDALERYAREIRAPRSYLIVECIRRVLAAAGPRPETRAKGKRPDRKR